MSALASFVLGQLSGTSVEGFDKNMPKLRLVLSPSTDNGHLPSNYNKFH